MWLMHHKHWTMTMPMRVCLVRVNRERHILDSVHHNKSQDMMGYGQSILGTLGLHAVYPPSSAFLLRIRWSRRTVFRIAITTIAMPPASKNIYIRRIGSSDSLVWRFGQNQLADTLCPESPRQTTFYPLDMGTFLKKEVTILATVFLLIVGSVF